MYLVITRTSRGRNHAAAVEVQEHFNLLNYIDNRVKSIEFYNEKAEAINEADSLNNYFKRS